ncbi:MAG: hypothetical protein IID49_00915 [Proteobacteria bacterium]|nr:hypothetical protein [Pseudomonadota bacterium]MCH8950677.1 hypothetical protein [Pseudomonadota bacterium]
MSSKHFPGFSLAALLVAAAGLFATQASAAELVWRIQSEHPNHVSVEFYSQDRNRAWPGGGDVHVIEDWDTHTYSLTCDHGETICYGAWVRDEDSTYWGVGRDDRFGCNNCCFTCGGGPTRTIVLNP